VLSVVALALTAAPALASGDGVSAGYQHTCALQGDGTPVCWGQDSTIPDATGALSQVSAGGYHSCGIKSDGTPVCWGRDDIGQTTIPPGTGTVTAIGAGFAHTCAIETDGTPACWGYDDDGETQIPPGTGTVSQISVGDYHTCAIKTDGTPTCWGYGTQGQTTIPPGTGTVEQLAAGLQHTCAIKADDTVTCWGDHGNGQSTVPADLGTVKQITAGAFHTCAIKTGGTPVCWGSDDFGQSTIPAGIGDVSRISAGFYHTCAVRTEGGVVCWGDDSAGQRGTPPAITSAAPPAHASAGPYSFTPDVSGSLGPSLFVTHGSLPPGLTLTHGQITGTPTTTGHYTGSLTASDGIFADASQAFSIDVDVDAPVTTDNVPSGPVNHDVTVTLAATDEGWGGVTHTYYTTDGTAPNIHSDEYDPANKPVLHDGRRIKYFSIDGADNAEAPRASDPVHIDTTAPTTTDDVPGGPVNHAVTVTLTASDDTGVAHTYYTTDGSSPAIYDPAHKPVLLDGQQITYYSVDLAGNAETAHTSGAPVDTKAPTVAITSPANGAAYKQGARVLAEYACSDTCTATAARGAAVDTRAAGRHTFTVSARDAAGNVTRRTVTYTVVAASTPPVADTTGPALTIPPKNKSLRVRSNKVTFTLGSALEPITGTIVLKAKRTKYGTGRFTGAAGTASKVKIKLTAKAKKALKKHKKVKVVATITVRDATGNPTVKSFKLTIKRR
jgi:alpha-tubulin suppressor-like RCC1 family protein